ncbi:MAG TPA: phosphatase PAP2 family protein [Bacteroidia bacterium]|nr:phosphatase PAP2 family protein [Sphingobacteriales bacterium]HPD65780.1 phosphatase PAP2 family protein [Bacteroidia bacterium]HRS59521.1 phosphatase PAP2 family protein [Bacteroidia bacterium]HRU67587.1 phosphatase PAP2 family protein [Bacteroidia bacterium]
MPRTITNMQDIIFQLDHRIFFLINRIWTNSFFDTFLPLFRDKFFWLPLYVFIFSFLIVNYRKQGWLIILFLIITVTLSDQFSSHLIKPLVHRLRPCKDPFFTEYVRTIVGCKPGFSFPSSHAANHFSVAFFLGLFFFRQARWVLPAGLVWAAIISYSQIYIGVHYPSDIIAGCFLGIFCALLSFSLFTFFLSRFGIILSRKT